MIQGDRADGDNASPLFLRDNAFFERERERERETERRQGQRSRRGRTRHYYFVSWKVSPHSQHNTENCFQPLGMRESDRQTDTHTHTSIKYLWVTLM